MEQNFLSDEVIKYIEKNKINEIISEGINRILIDLPDNPWTHFIDCFNSNLKPEIKLLKAKSKVVLNNSLQSIYVLQLNFSFKNEKASIKMKVLSSELETNDSVEISSLLFNSADKTARKDKLDEIDKLIEHHLKEVNLYDIDTWMSCMSKMKLQNKSLYTFLGFSIEWIHFRLHSKFESTDFPSYLEKQSIIRQNDHEKTKMYFYFLHSNKSSAKSSKSVYFSVNAPTELEIIKTAQEFMTFAKTELEANKAFSNRIFYFSGSLVNPFDLMSETIKFINDLYVKFPKREQLRFTINVNANDNFDSATSKFTIDGSKKPLNDEEFEDYLFKMVADKKWIETLIDPFPISLNLNWHRLNKKLRERQASIRFSTSHLEALDIHRFSKIETDKYPAIKADQMAKIIDCVVSIADGWIKVDSLNELMEIGRRKTIRDKEADLRIVLMGTGNDNYLTVQFAQMIGADIVISPKDIQLLKSILNEYSS